MAVSRGSRLQEYLMANPMYSMGSSVSKAGTSTEPVHSTIEGIARALQGGIGGLMQGYAMGEAKASRKKDTESALALLSNKDPTKEAELLAAAGDHPDIVPLLARREEQREKLAAAMEARQQQVEFRKDMIRLTADLRQGRADPNEAADIYIRRQAEVDENRAKNRPDPAIATNEKIRLEEEKQRMKGEAAKKAFDRLLESLPTPPGAVASPGKPQGSNDAPGPMQDAPPVVVPPEGGVPSQGDATLGGSPQGRTPWLGHDWLDSDIAAYKAAAASGDPKKIADVLRQGGENAAKFREDQRKANELKAMPPTAAAELTNNYAMMSMIDRAIRDVKEKPDAFGWQRGALSQVGDLSGSNMKDRIYPSEAKYTANVANIGSMIIHERAGANTTALEVPRLRPFIPVVGDPPEVIEAKLIELRKRAADITQSLTNYYSPKNKFFPHTAAERVQNDLSAVAPTVAAPPVAVPQQQAPQGADAKKRLYDKYKLN